MIRRVTPSQFQSMVRQAQQKQRQAIDKYNREVRAHNQKVSQAINNHNRQVQAYNARVRANQQRLRNEVMRLSRQTVTTHYVSLRASVRVVHSAYERLEHAAESGSFDERHSELLDLSEREAANSAAVMNALLGDEEATKSLQHALESELTPQLQVVSSDLAARWKGAVFSLNPHNPDAARHFCTSSREVLTRILELKAPDSEVVATAPSCARTQLGTPTRRAKLRHLLQRAGNAQGELEEFVESDISNIVDLFQVFNDGTHGSAGTFTLAQLQAIRARVEDGIEFLLKVIR
jgi:Predicted pPIWI-associating nuclease